MTHTKSRALRGLHNLRLDLTKAAPVPLCGVEVELEPRRGRERVALLVDALTAAPIIFAEASLAAFAAQPRVVQTEKDHDKRR